MRPARIAALIVVAALAFAACSGSSTAAPAATPAPAASAAPAGGGSPAAVTIQNFAFAPADLTVAVGTTVTWTNMDSTNHTVTADDGSWKSDQLGNGATFSQTFTTAGTFAYHCSIHPSMKATITVK